MDAFCKRLLNSVKKRANSKGEHHPRGYQSITVPRYIVIQDGDDTWYEMCISMMRAIELAQKRKAPEGAKVVWKLQL